MLYCYCNDTKLMREVDKMSVKINLGAWNSVFAVPSKIVDEGLKFSDGVKLKVLLYVLRNSGDSLDERAISKGTGVNVTDIPEAIEYWVSMGILEKANNEYLPAANDTSAPQISEKEIKSSNNSNNENKPEEKKQPPKPQEKPRFTVTKPQKPDYFFTSQRLKDDGELQLLVGEAQISFGKTLSTGDASTLLMLKDTCGLPPDVILMILGYCVSVDKCNMRTVEKIGIEWADDGIYSVEAAENKIRQIKRTSKNFSIVSSAFGLKNIGSPTKKQLEYGDKWIGEWKFPPEMLREAYERCVDTKGDMNFRYIDGILKRWNSNGLNSLEKLAKFEKSGSGKKSKQKASYDIDELEKIETLDNF